jgi:hypothetical protein
MDTRDKYDALVSKVLRLYEEKHGCWAGVLQDLSEEIDQLAKEMAMTNVTVFALIVDDAEAQVSANSHRIS